MGPKHGVMTIGGSNLASAAGSSGAAARLHASAAGLVSSFASSAALRCSHRARSGSACTSRPCMSSAGALTQSLARAWRRARRSDDMGGADSCAELSAGKALPKMRCGWGGVRRVGVKRGGGGGGYGCGMDCGMYCGMYCGMDCGIGCGYAIRKDDGFRLRAPRSVRSVFLPLTHFPHMSYPIFPIYHRHFLCLCDERRDACATRPLERRILRRQEEPEAVGSRKRPPRRNNVARLTSGCDKWGVTSGV